jgi:hypothetical protein
LLANYRASAEVSGYDGLGLTIQPQRHARRAAMTNLEQLEMSRYQNELGHDVRHLVKKYCRIMGWEVPELDEAEARGLIFNALREALETAEKE